MKRNNIGDIRRKIFWDSKHNITTENINSEVEEMINNENEYTEERGTTKNNRYSYLKSKQNGISYKDIKLTTHSIIRAEERLNITSANEIKKRAASARRKGIRLENVNKDNIKKFLALGLNYTDWVYFTQHFRIKEKSTRFYLYKEYIWIFGGDGGKTLKTVVKITDN